MRRSLARTIPILAATLAAAATLVPTADAARVAHRGGPSRTQIGKSVYGAKHSRYLWATVNVCDRRHRGGVIGIRGQMPALGFTATLSMTVHLGQYDTATHRFVPVSGSTATDTVSLGTVTRGVHQDGAEFPYATNAGTLDATVTFTWTRAGHRLATVSRTTTGGHPTAAFGVPAHHSAASCRL